MKKAERLKRRLGLWDVFALSTGAMFSSGFFLLPGIAAAESGPSVFLAYLLAGVVMIPPMLSMAELSTAMPRAGGAYFILDRSLGHLAGTVGGLGTWLVLILKSAFALVGVGAYLGILFEAPIQIVAVALAVTFGVMNTLESKHSTGLQKMLVAYLLAALFLFLIQGLQWTLAQGIVSVHQDRFDPFLPFGIHGLLAATGTVFVSYAGLTKVASLAEEIKDPDRNIPLGMILSLGVTTIIYTGGVYLIVTILSPDELRGSLAPVALAGARVMDWLPLQAGLYLIVFAAVAAFASTGNAGILSASRYPLAMARDRLVPGYFAVLGRSRTPVHAVTLTTLLVAGAILFIDVAEIAKLASSFQLLVFAFINGAVIVMRRACIEGYRPGFKAPLYPWLQLAGIAGALLLIYEIGRLEIFFSAILIGFSSLWYFLYGRKRSRPKGAVHHLRGDSQACEESGLGKEMREILEMRFATEEDNFGAMVMAGQTLDFSKVSPERISAPLLKRTISRCAAFRTGVDAPLIGDLLFRNEQTRITASEQVIILETVRVGGKRTEVILIRLPEGFRADPEEFPFLTFKNKEVRAVLVMLSPRRFRKRHLRMIGEALNHINSSDFMERWTEAPNGASLRRVLQGKE